MSGVEQLRRERDRLKLEAAKLEAVIERKRGVSKATTAAFSMLAFIDAVSITFAIPLVATVIGIALGLGQEANLSYTSVRLQELRYQVKQKNMAIRSARWGVVFRTVAALLVAALALLNSYLITALVAWKAIVTATALTGALAMAIADNGSEAITVLVLGVLLTVTKLSAGFWFEDWKPGVLLTVIISLLAI